MVQWAFSCRHDYESDLRSELARLTAGWPVPLQSEIAMPGLVLATVAETLDDPDLLRAKLAELDPVYALQVLPQVARVSAASVSALADGCMDAVRPLWQLLAGSRDGGRFAVHVLVPGQLKGQPRPQLQHRAELLTHALKQRIMKGEVQRPAKTAPAGRLLQVLLLDAESALVSAAPVLQLGGAMSWPSLLPAGLANPPDDDAAPSSAFRKLREALACMGEEPGPDQLAVDLGASPGGWSHVLRSCGAEVFAVDRAELDRRLMRDPQVHWVEGDAFRWLPAEPVQWMVSDVIAFPHRVPELLAVWCSAPWARRIVVQMKFKGSPDFDLIEAALAVARQAGWWVRAKHFFNDKHEVTFMGGLLNSRDGLGPTAEGGIQ